MNDPIRLRDDAAASDVCRQLLEANEGELDPPSYDASRGLLRFRTALAGRAPVLFEAPRPVVRPRRRAVLLALQLAACLVAAAAVSGATIWVYRARTPSTMVPTPPRASRPSLAEPSPKLIVPPIADATAEPSAEREIERGRSPAPSHGRATHQAPPEPTVGAGAPSSDVNRLTAETADIARLRSAQSDPARALALAEDGTRNFPNGFFSQEREAIAVNALVQLGRTGEARDRGGRFLAQHPRGPAAERIRRALGLPSP